MGYKDQYTCPRCGYVFSILLNADEWQRTINCRKCQKVMNIRNRFHIQNAVKSKKKAHYLHKSLLN